MTSPALPKTAECVIIGGGVVGCSLAYHLACQGMTSVVIERDSLGNGSTAKCAGGVRAQFATEVNIRVCMLSKHLLEEFPDELGVSADYRTIGYLLLTSTNEGADQFARNVQLQRSVGLHDVELLTVDRVRELVPDVTTDDLVCGTWCPSDGLAGPHEVTTGYANGARNRGVTIIEGAAVTGIDRHSDRVTAVRVGDDVIATETVVNCAGPYASDMGTLAQVDVPVLPYRRHIFVTEQFPLPYSLPMVVDFDKSFYCHPEGSGVLLGLTDPDEQPSTNTTVDWSFLESVAAAAAHRLPVLQDAQIATGWAGLYEVSPDNQAIVGASSELQGLWLACGFSGHGFMQAPAMGKLLAETMVGKVPSIDITPLSPDRFARCEFTPEMAVI